MSDAESRAGHAKRLMDDPVLAEAFENVRQAAINAWIGTSTDQGHAREVAWLTVKVTDRIKAELQSIIDNGLIAASRVQAPLR